MKFGFTMTPSNAQFNGLNFPPGVNHLVTRFPRDSLFSSFGENRTSHSHFRGVHQITKQPATFSMFSSIPR